MSLRIFAATLSGILTSLAILLNVFSPILSCVAAFFSTLLPLFLKPFTTLLNIPLSFSSLLCWRLSSKASLRFWLSRASSAVVWLQSRTALNPEKIIIPTNKIHVLIILLSKSRHYFLLDDLLISLITISVSFSTSSRFRHSHTFKCEPM